MRVNAKEREVKRAKKREGIEVERVKPSAPTQVIGALKEEEEQNEYRKKEQKERNKEQGSNPATLDHSVASYDPQGSTSEPILVTMQPTGELLRFYTNKQDSPSCWLTKVPIYRF